MSVQSYLDSVKFDDRLHARNQSPVALTAEGHALECQVVLKVTVGLDGEKFRSSSFTVVGGSGSTLSNMFQYASIVAEHIARLSKGVMAGLYFKVGKYRNDEVPDDVPSGDYSSGIIDLINAPADEYGLSACSNQRNLYPANVVTSRVYIPWVRDDISKSDIWATIDDLQQYELDGVEYSIGAVRFGNENKDYMVAYPTNYMKNYFIKGRSRKSMGYLANNDTELGIVPDGVSSEEFAEINQGFGDDGSGSTIPNNNSTPNP